MNRSVFAQRKKTLVRNCAFCLFFFAFLLWALFLDRPATRAAISSKPGIGVPRVTQNANGTVDVTVEVQSAKEELTRDGKTQVVASGVYDLRLFRDGQLVGSSTTREATERYISAAPAAVAKDLVSKELLDTAETRLWREANDMARVVKFDDAGKATYTFRNIKLPRDGRKEVELSAYAFNSDRVKSETVRTVYKLTDSTIQNGRTYLISIGVNASESSSFRLDFAANDARKMQELLAPRLEATGKRVVKIPLIADHDPVTKTPKGGNTATKAIIKSVFELLAGNAGIVPKDVLAQIPNAAAIAPVEPEDTVIITYSGHGYVDTSGIFYLLPYDIGAGTKRLTTDVLPRLISSDELSLWMRDITGKEMLMVVDACHSSAAVQGPGFKPGPLGSRGLGQLAYDKGIKILAATQADNVALELNKLQQGLLSYALLQDGIALKKADTIGPDNKLTAAEWFNYGQQRVPKLYEDIKTGRLEVIVDGKRRSDPLDLAGDKTERAVQRPGLFDFRKKEAETALVILR